ncbi:OLC1v1016609C1 [Oldenlandia corymbosa var. corymbosa]|uniref:DNA-directed RNA polymerase subunit n=1 Tax=Oldenlandia corymbosa var. corymbosa TaxID=529605 RepID=A0AAV1E7J4_OLDCO|nr:OLC1v1016609C1 [Oldenlandia corymbosa var. corymbosa]
MDIRFPYSPAEVVKVRRVQFGVLSPDEIRQMSVVHIDHSETTERGKPKPGGLSDPRLGTIDRKLKCETCTANMAECPGTLGTLNLQSRCSTLARRIRNPKNRLKKILEACKTKSKCAGRDEIELDGQGEDDSDELLSEKKPPRSGCGALQPSISIYGMKMVAEFRVQKKKKNNDDQDQLPEPVERKQELSAEKFHIATYFDKELPGLPRATQKYGRPIKSICSRLKGKEGRARGNLMGKWVDFSARTVITPDPTINIDELGVPWSIALNLTYPETVTPFNIDKLKEAAKYGPNPPPAKTGAKYIIRDDGQRLDLRYLKDPHLEVGYKVERHLVDGAEVSELMMVPKCIVSPQSNKPVMGIVQDTLLGSHLITKRDNFIEKDVFMNILMWWEDFDGKVPAPTILKPKPLWTGKQVFNLIISRQINLQKRAADDDKGPLTPGDTRVCIEKGELLSGTLCKKTLGPCVGSLIHIIWEEVGPDAAQKFLGLTQWLVNYWILQNGFSVGIGDTIGDADTMEKINIRISEAKNKVKELIKKAQEKNLEPEPGRTRMESFENQVNKKSLSESNNLKAMVTARSKESFVNISQMTACVGQRNVEGKRIPFGFVDRTLPHFTKDDFGPESRGFVENSYLRGLTPQEFFFHAMGGRECIIDTAVKTSETGYIQRQLMKAMEDIMVKYDGTVRNSLGDVIRFLYGEDGMDSVWVESQKLESLNVKKPDFDSRFKFELDDKDWDPDYMFPEKVEKLETDRLQLATEIATSGDDIWPLPVNIKRLILNAQKIFKSDFRRPSDMNPIEVVDAVDKLQERLTVVHGDDYLSKEAQKNATDFFNILLRSALASKRVLNEYRLTKEAFHWVIGEIESQFSQSHVAPGEMIGCIAAQSRLKEIINVAKNIKTPSLSIYLKPIPGITDDFAKSDETRKKKAKERHTSRRSLVRSISPEYHNPENDKFVQLYYEMPDEETDPDKISPWLLRIELDRTMLLDKNLMTDIAAKIELEFGGDLICIFNDDNADKLILRIRIMNDEAAKGESNNESGEDDVFLKKIENNMLTQIALRGIPGINKVFLKHIKPNKFNEEEGGFKARIEWMLDTEGVNLLAAMCLEDVDGRRTTSNNLIEVIEVLGIEAVRKTLLDELRVVISFDGSYVNYRHLAIL